jgi:hypothetical protein
MVWRLVGRSVVSVIALCTFLGVCWLVANVVPEKVGKIVFLGALLCLFPAIFMAIGWIRQVAEPTDQPPRPSRRLKEVPQGDSAGASPEQSPERSTVLRRAA